MENIDFDPKNPENRGNTHEVNKSENNEFEKSLDEEDHESIEDEADCRHLDEDDYDNYSRSGEKYRWYNGWSDDDIDNAFEGDPENTLECRLISASSQKV